ncbi:unnamed protein product [Blepharisma stoltei]|uniref:CS domain-containing protein n=1 Tax=Blepharisma stoltei TaxID=1481888 RepID=A0AAU9J6L4_9CILI|nr:unnamed protein product [Blepharisma stoltei]
MFFLTLLHVSFGLLCEDMFEQAYDLKDIIAQQIVPEHLSAQCISSYIKKGAYEEAEYLISKAGSSKVDLNSVMNLLLSYKRSIASLTSLFDVENEPQIVKPSFRWAQSLTHIYLDIKFSHRFDSAGCTHVYDKIIKVKKDHLEFSAKCIYSKQKLQFELNLPFYEVIDTRYTETNEILTGRLEIKIQKWKAPSVWPQIYSGEKPQNMSPWWDMQEQFNEQLKQHQDLNAL